MQWFQGDVSEAIQKAITEQKMFIVFVRDDKEESQKMEELCNSDEVKNICTDDLCVAINITVDSEAGQQFGAIYPIAFLPCTFFIENDGIPAAIFPTMEKDKFVEKTEELMAVVRKLKSGESQKPASEAQQQDSPSETTSSDAVGNEEPTNSTSASEEELTKKEKADLLILKAKAKKAQKEKQEAREREQKRRDEGRELSHARRDLAERQAKQLADDLAKRREEERAARERVKQQIKQDREDKVARFEAEKKAREETKQQKVAEKDAEKEAKAQAVKAARDAAARIQFRLPDGSTSFKQFPSDAKFIVVVNHVTKELAPHIPIVRLTTVYPKHEYTQEDHSKSLRDLGLSPNASVIVSHGRASSSSSSSLNPISILTTVLAPLLALIYWFFSLFKSTPTTTTPNEAPSAQQQEPSSNSNSTNDHRDASVRRRNLGGGSNIRRLYDDKPDDEDNATWNGNSTQQM